MKTSPFKIQGGVSPLKQNIPVDPMAGEGSVDSMVGNKKQSEIKYNTAGDDGFDDIAQFAPITGEITDAKNAIKEVTPTKPILVKSILTHTLFKLIESNHK